MSSIKVKRNRVGNRLVVAALNRFTTDFEHYAVNLEEARQKFDKISTSGKKIMVESVKNHSIGGIKVREYRNASNAPYLVYFHGGGYVMGGLESHDILCRRITKFCNLNVISIEYGLAPEKKFPHQLEEGRRVIDTLLEKNRMLYIGGDSAGGNMAAALSAEYVGKIRAQILFYPVLDANLVASSIERIGITSNYLTADLLRWFRDQYLPADTNLNIPTLSPINAKTLVPTFLSVGTRDPLLDEAIQYAKLLKSKNVKHDLFILPHALHGFMQFPRRFGYPLVFKKLNAFLESLI